MRRYEIILIVTRLSQRKYWLENKRHICISFQGFNIYSRAETKEDEPCPAREAICHVQCDQVVSVAGPPDKSSLSWILKWRTVNNVTVQCHDAWGMFFFLSSSHTRDNVYSKFISGCFHTWKNSWNISVIVFYARSECLVSENSGDVIFQTFPKFTFLKHFEGR